MKYIFKLNLYTFFKNNLKYLIIYHLILGLYFLSYYIINNTITLNDFIYSLGITYQKNDSILNTLIFFWQFGFHLFIILQIFDNNYISILLSRMTKIKYFFIKIFSIIIIQTIIYIPILIFGLICKLSFLKIIKYTIISYIIYILIELIFFYILIFSKKYKYILTILAITLIITGIIPISIYQIEKYLIFIIITILCLLLLCYILINYNFINIIESEVQNENRS